MATKHYAIRNKRTGKFFRYPPDAVNTDRMEWVTGVNRAFIYLEKSTAEYVIEKFELTGTEIITLVEDYGITKAGKYGKIRTIVKE